MTDMTHPILKALEEAAKRPLILIPRQLSWEVERETAPTNTPTPERRDFGTLRLRGHTWWVRYKIDGKCYEESSGSTDRRKAEKVLARREAELGHGESSASWLTPCGKRSTIWPSCYARTTWQRATVRLPAPRGPSCA